MLRSRLRWLVPGLSVVALGLGAPTLAAQLHVAHSAEGLRSELQRKLDSLRVAARIPGATLGVALADGSILALATGFADTARRTPLRPTDRLLSGSVGKTYVSAVALQLVHEGKLDLDAKISRYLGNELWFARLPNARDITVRQLMTHTSGLVRYEFQPAFTAVLRQHPTKTWTPEERLGYVIDTKAPFAAGQGWEYSDTNYIVLGMIIERLTGRPYYDELRRRVLDPLRLANTIPSDRQELPGIANGYAGPQNELGGYDASVVDGRLAVNPQLEWTGGGIASTAEDLARWGKLLYEGKAFDPSLLPQLLAGVPARLGPNVRYGLGAMIRSTAIGAAYGHGGFFPGYATEMLYFPDARVAVAIQVNSTNPYPRGLVPFVVEIARTVSGGSSVQQSDEREVLATVQRLFDAMRTRDTATMRGLFDRGGRLVGMRTRQTGERIAQSLTADQFADYVARDTRAPWIERMWNPQVTVRGTLATVWTEYDFHFGTQFSHCGVDSFQLLKVPGRGWQIVSIADTFEREGCPSRPAPNP